MRRESMSDNSENRGDDELRPEYDLSQLKSRIRGKYRDHSTPNSAQSVIRLIAGFAAVFIAHVGVPFAFVSVARSRALPDWLFWIAETIDPAIWMILSPFALACIGYNFVMRYCGLARLADSRLVRWPIAFATALISQCVEMYWIFNTFGS